MNSDANDGNVLWELAQTMTDRDSYPAAIGLRKLAQAGYSTLEEVDTASDWVLLATPGIGVGRLGAVRRLIRPSWQPPSRKAVAVARRFLKAARLALRFWPMEALVSVVEGSPPMLTADTPAELRLALESFCVAARRALHHGEPEMWILALQQLVCKRGDRNCDRSETGRANGSHASATVEHLSRPLARNPTEKAPEQQAISPDSRHYAYTAEERRQIVVHYRTALQEGEVENKEAWACNNYRISRKTLWRYEQEFPESAVRSLP